MENVMKTVTDYCTDAAFHLLLALAVWLIGKALIKTAGKAMKKANLFTKLDQTAGSFAQCDCYGSVYCSYYFGGQYSRCSDGFHDHGAGIRSNGSQSGIAGITRKCGGRIYAAAVQTVQCRRLHMP